MGKNGRRWEERGYIVLNSLLVIKLVYYKIINKFRIIYIENCKIYITKLQKLILSKWITLTFPCTFYETRSSSKIYNLLNSIHWLSSNERIHSNKQKIPFVLSSYCFQSVRPSRRRASLTTYTLRLRTLFLAAQKGCTPCTKNKLQRGCLSTDASWRVSSRGYVSLPLSTLSSSHHQQTSPTSLLLQGVDAKKFLPPAILSRDDRVTGDCRNGTDPLFCISVKRDGRRLRNLPPLFLSLSLPLLRVGRSMSRLDMWRMKGAEQPTCTRETIFFSSLSFSLSFFFSLFFAFFPFPPPPPPPF